MIKDVLRLLAYFNPRSRKGSDKGIRYLGQ